MVETLKLTTNKYIQLIQAGKDTYYVIAIGKDEITVLGQLSGDELRELPTDKDQEIPTVKGDFSDLLHKFKDQLPKK